mgnify:CR=1 FL=1
MAAAQRPGSPPASEADVAEEAVQERACGALLRLASDSAAYKVAIALEGGVIAILDAMRRHAGRQAVQDEPPKHIFLAHGGQEPDQKHCREQPQKGWFAIAQHGIHDLARIYADVLKRYFA